MIRKYTESKINSNYRKTKKEIIEERDYYCESCGKSGQITVLTPSHLISRADSKRYNCIELIWDKKNIRIHCVDCHRNWENGTKKGADFEGNMEYILYLKEQEIISNELYMKYQNRWKK